MVRVKRDNHWGRRKESLQPVQVGCQTIICREFLMIESQRRLSLSQKGRDSRKERWKTGKKERDDDEEKKEASCKKGGRRRNEEIQIEEKKKSASAKSRKEHWGSILFPPFLLNLKSSLFSPRDGVFTEKKGDASPKWKEMASVREKTRTRNLGRDYRETTTDKLEERSLFRLSSAGESR